MTQRKVLAFDIESATFAPDSWGADYNLGVTCIGWCKIAGDEVESGVFTPMLTMDIATGESYYDRIMHYSQIAIFLEFLKTHLRTGWTIVSMNGAGFDFRVMSHCGRETLAKELALHHVDIGFALFAQRGFMLSLKKMCADFELTKGEMGGVGAVMEWASLDRLKQQRVLTYVELDAVITGKLYCRILDAGGVITWTSRKGSKASHEFIRIKDAGHFRLQTVSEALKLKEPDVSYMQNPWERKRFVRWLRR